MLYYMYSQPKQKQKKGNEKMTKEEAIKFIESCDGDICGFSVNVVSSEDIHCHCDLRTINSFDELSVEKKEEVLSNLADELKDTYEECHFHDDFNEVNFYDYV